MLWYVWPDIVGWNTERPEQQSILQFTDSNERGVHDLLQGSGGERGVGVVWEVILEPDVYGL